MKSNVEVAFYLGFYTFSELLGTRSTLSVGELNYLKLCIGLAGYLVCNKGDVRFNLIRICNMNRAWVDLLLHGI